jgi:hypothetical protein
LPFAPTPFPMLSNSMRTLGQGTTLPSTVSGPHKPSNSQSLLLPLPQPGILFLPVQALRSYSTRNLELQEAQSTNYAKKNMEISRGLQAGPLECLLCNKGSHRELESPWPPCCARKPGTSKWASRAELSGRARAASLAAPALPLAVATAAAAAAARLYANELGTRRAEKELNS